jgi:tRNA(adenine34) deaminase
MQEKERMRKVIEEAEKALENGEVPIASILVEDGKEIARSQTRVTRDSKTAAHAELLTLLEAGEIFEPEGELVLYTNLEPCLMCLGAAARCNVDRIVYAMDAAEEEDSEKIEDVIEADVELESGVLEDRSIELFRRFLEEKENHFAKGYVSEIVSGSKD